MIKLNLNKYVSTASLYDCGVSIYINDDFIELEVYCLVNDFKTRYALSCLAVKTSKIDLIDKQIMKMGKMIEEKNGEYYKK